MGNAQSMKDAAIDYLIAMNLRYMDFSENSENQGDHETQENNQSLKPLYINQIQCDAYIIFEFVNLLCAPPPKPIPMPNENMRKRAEEMYPGLATTYAINIAIIGGPDTGKMSLINVMTGRKKESAIIKSEQPTKFMHVDLDHIQLWLMPDDYGSGSHDHDYFHKKCLYAFDAILFLENNKIRPGDIELAKQARSMDPPIPVAFVRSKIDGDLIMGIRRCENEGEWEAEKKHITDRIRGSLRKQLDDSLKNVQILLVSQAALLEVIAKEWGDRKYLVDDFGLYAFLMETIKDRRYVE